MACWIRGSARIRAKTNASTPPTAPAMTPRRMSRFSMSSTGRSSVAREAEEMAAVVHELVHVGVAAEDRHGALVDADKVVDQQGQQRGAAEPEQRPGEGQDQWRRLRGRLGAGDGAHRWPPSGIVRPSFGWGVVTV